MTAVFGKEHCFFGCGVSAADYHEVFVAKNGDGAVTDCARADAVLPVFVFAGEIEPASGGAGGDYERGGCDRGVGVFGPDLEGSTAEVNFFDGFGDDFGTEAGGLGTHIILDVEDVKLDTRLITRVKEEDKGEGEEEANHQLTAADTSRETGEVFDIGGCR